MKREIKFRGLYKGHFVHGNLIVGNIEGRTFYEIEQSHFDDFQKWDVEPETVGQYTGLKDKNGVQIYEGDILRSDGVNADDAVNYAVEYSAPEFTRRLLDVSQRHTDWNGLLTGGLYQYKIIRRELHIVGNIHQNPELVTPVAERADANSTSE